MKCSATTYPWEDSWPFVQALLEAFTPDRCMWGSDWPFLRAPERIDYGLVLALIERLIPDPGDRRKVLWETPMRLFGFDESPPQPRALGPARGGPTQMNDTPVAVVTGGAGGLGSAIGRALTSDGFQVVLAGRNFAAAQRVADDIGDSCGFRPHPGQVDVTDRESVAKLVTRNR